MPSAKPITIIGGGLAGLTLGIGLRQRGVPVTVWEAGNYPRHRVCGEFISGNGPAVLKRLGLLDKFELAGAFLARTALFISGKNRSPLRELQMPALCLSRYKMDALLAEEFQKLGGELRADSRWSGDKHCAGVVQAGGRRADTATKNPRWFGVKAHVPRDEALKLEADLEMHISRDGYVGVNRINGGEVNVCGLFRVRDGMRRSESKQDWLRGGENSSLRLRLGAAQFDAASFCSVAGLQLKPHRAADQEDCRIGDALTMTPPITGNGMSMAFESAEIASAPLAAFSEGRLDWPQARRETARRCDAAFGRRLAWARWLQWMMMSPVLPGRFGGMLLRSDRLWQSMFLRTR
jgi:menaquinone-9 beta-reductase